MSNKMSADAEAYDKEYDAFIRQLEEFHQQRGSSFKRLPRINGKGIDLYLLYVVVTARGGWQKVNSRTEWEDILEDFRLPSSCVNAAVALKHIYIRYLDVYERINFLGEDGDENGNNADDDDSRTMRVRRNVRMLNIVPLSYNHSQHNVSDTLRTNSGMSTELYKNSLYDRLALSLSCPLPNEHDFALNLCTLLSNEGKHTIQLSQCPRLIEFMLAHTGVFRDRETQTYFIKNYKDAKGKSLVQFWIDSVEDKSVLDLLSPDAYDEDSDNPLEQSINYEKTLKSNLLYIKPLNLLTSKESPNKDVEDSEYGDSRNDDQRGNGAQFAVEEKSPSKIGCRRRDTLSTKLEDMFKALCSEDADLKLAPDDTQIFHLGRDLGLLDSEGTRISQVLHILRNLSFDEINVPSLAQSTTCLRFLVLCVCSRWGGLAVGALDTLGNIAAEVILRDPAVDPASALLLTTICQGVSSQDRAFVLRSLEVLNKLAVNDPNEEILSYNIEQCVYDQICRFLTIHDIMLLIYTLESLYSLSSLGMAACNAIVRAKGSVQTLISLLTVEAQSYGPEACIGMKVVETVTGVVSETDSVSSTATANQASNVSATTTVTTNTLAVTSHSNLQAMTVAPTPVVAPISSPPVPLAPTCVKVTPKVEAKRIIPRIVPPEVEDFVISWVSRNYEACPQNAIEQAIVYRHFAASMHSLGRKQGLNPVLLSNCVRKVFGTGVGPSRRPVEDGTEKWHYNGIKRRDGIVVPAVPDKKVASQPNSCSPQLTPTPIIPAASLPAPSGSTSTLTTALSRTEKQIVQPPQGSILKAHLSAPLRNSPSPVKVTNHGVMGGSVPPSAHTSPYSSTLPNPGPTSSPQLPIPRSDNSSLIKSLLANKVTSSGPGSSFHSYPSEHLSAAASKKNPYQQHHLSHHQAPSPKSQVSQGLVKTTSQSIVSHNKQFTGMSPTTSGPLPPISNIASFSKVPISRQIGSLIANSPSSLSGKIPPASMTLPLGSGQQPQKNPNIQQTHLQPQVAPSLQPQHPQNQQVFQQTNLQSSQPSKSPILQISQQQIISPQQPQLQQVQQPQRLPQPYQQSKLHHHLQSQQSQPRFTHPSQLQQQFQQSQQHPIPPSQQQHVQQPHLQQVQQSQQEVTHIQQALKQQQPVAQQGQLPFALPTAQRVSRNIQKQNGPAENLQENSTDAQSVKSAINGIKEEPTEDGKIVTSFEGILQNGLKEEMKEENLIKDEKVDATSGNQVEKHNLLADLLEKTVGGDLLNGVVDKDIRITEKGIQIVGHNLINKMNGPISSNGQLEVSHGIKRPATPDSSSGSVKRLAIEDPRGQITLYVSQNGNDGGEVISQGHQVILNQGQQLQQIVSNQAPVVNAQTVVTNQGSMIIRGGPPSHGNMIVQQSSPHIISQGNSNQIIAQRTAISTQGTSSPIITQSTQGQTQVISSGTQVLNQNTGQVIHQVLTHGQSGQKVILHSGQLGQVFGGQVIVPQNSTQGIVVQGSGNIPGQVIMQGINPGTQNPVIVQGPSGHSQVLVHTSGNQSQQVLLHSNNSQGPLVVSGGSQGQSIVTSNSQSPVVVTNSSGQAMIVAGNQGQQVVVNSPSQNQGQVVMQSNSVGNTVFLTPQQASQAGQKTLIILPNPKVMVTGNQQSGQVVLPRQVVQQIASSSTSSPIISNPVRTVRSVPSAGESNSSALSNSSLSPNTSVVANHPSGPSATPVLQTVTSSTPHIPAPQILSSGVARRQAKPLGLQFICEWRGCNLVFSSPNQVYYHACKVHCPPHITELTCMWAGCDTMVRKRFSTMNHIQERHCNEQLMQIVALRRQQISISGKTDIPTPQTPPPHPGYAPNAAFHAIKRHALEVINQRDAVEKEGPVTKSIRLTSALILRNLVIYSNMGKKLLRGYESHLANVAISSMESSRTVSQILYDIHLPDHQAL